jgi:hypothetical protein
MEGIGAAALAILLELVQRTVHVTCALYHVKQHILIKQSKVLIPSFWM